MTYYFASFIIITIITSAIRHLPLDIDFAQRCPVAESNLHPTRTHSRNISVSYVLKYITK